MGRLSPEERTARGPAIHAARDAVTSAIADRKAALAIDPHIGKRAVRYGLEK